MVVSSWIVDILRSVVECSYSPPSNHYTMVLCRNNISSCHISHIQHRQYLKQNLFFQYVNQKAEIQMQWLNIRHEANMLTYSAVLNSVPCIELANKPIYSFHNVVYGVAKTNMR